MKKILMVATLFAAAISVTYGFAVAENPRPGDPCNDVGEYSCNSDNTAILFCNRYNVWAAYEICPQGKYCVKTSQAGGIEGIGCYTLSFSEN